LSGLKFLLNGLGEILAPKPLAQLILHELSYALNVGVFQPVLGCRVFWFAVPLPVSFPGRGGHACHFVDQGARILSLLQGLSNPLDSVFPLIQCLMNDFLPLLHRFTQVLLIGAFSCAFGHFPQDEIT